MCSRGLQAIEELPGQESPEIFGLHPNADLTFRTLQVQAGVQLIVDTQPKGGSGGGRLSREQVVDRICEDLLSKVISSPALHSYPALQNQAARLPDIDHSGSVSFSIPCMMLTPRKTPLLVW